MYTTQSNVSKTIASLEKSVGAALFVRQSRGITLTAKGKHVYKYACRIMEEVGALGDFSTTGEMEWLNVSCNSSSWFANRFVEFYHLHSGENIHCQVYTSGTRTIMNRIRDYKDDVGFVYMMGSQKADFKYALGRHHLDFIPLVQVTPMLYLGEKNPLYEQKQNGRDELKNLRFIQNYQDEFTKDMKWIIQENEEETLENMDVAVITNSDYLMKKMLSETELANISGSYLNHGEEQNRRNGIPLKQKNDVVEFGYLKREGEPLGKMAELFVEFIRDAL